MKTDMHSHIIPNVDDGSQSIDESINILKEAYEAGFEKIFCTSHFIENFYEPDINTKHEHIKLLKNKLNENNIKIELYTGNEVLIVPNLIELLENKKVETLNNSRYLLIEFPLKTKINFMEDMLYKLANINIVPIIAHPERYEFIKNDITICDKILEFGALFQCNYASIIGYYGHTAKKVASKLLKQNKVSFLGSDVHRANTIYLQMNKISKKIENKIGKEKFIELTEVNPQKVVDDLKI